MSRIKTTIFVTSCCMKTSVYFESPRYSKTSWSSTFDATCWKLFEENPFSCLNDDKAQLACRDADRESTIKIFYRIKWLIPQKKIKVENNTLIQGISWVSPGE